MNAMRALLLDTSVSTLMAAVAVDGRIVARLSETSTSQRYHSAVLAERLRQLLQSCSLAPGDLTVLGVAIGPGSFTGLRTGLASARALGQFLPLTCYAFSAFDLLLAAEPLDRPIAVALDALQGRAYAAIREAGGAWRQAPALVTLADWRDALPPDARLLASGSLMPLLANVCDQTQSVESLHRFTPEAMVALLAHNPPATPWRDLLPLYLQAPNVTLRAKR